MAPLPFHKIQKREKDDRKKQPKCDAGLTRRPSDREKRDLERNSRDSRGGGEHRESRELSTKIDHRHHRTKESSSSSSHRDRSERDRDREWERERDRERERERDRDRDRERERDRVRDRERERDRDRDHRVVEDRHQRQRDKVPTSGRRHRDGGRHSDGVRSSHNHNSSSSTSINNTNITSSSSALAYKSQRRSYDERQRRRSRSRSRTPGGTPPPSSNRRRQQQHQQQGQRTYRGRDTSSGSRTPPTVKKSSDGSIHQSSAVSSAALAAANSAIAMANASSTAAASSGGGLLPTPNYAPKIPSLMSLELNTPKHTATAVTASVAGDASLVTGATAAGSAAPIQLPSYYNPGIINANRYAEQQQKRKLIWGAKKSEDSANKWGNAHFSQDSDGKVASKFMRLMGIKNNNSTEGGPAVGVEAASEATVAAAPTAAGEESINGDNRAAGAVAGATGIPADVQLRQRMFSTMEQQYEVARAATHTMRGVGLGFGSQPRTF
ncbi:arginine/serine-rich coiled-coil protein 2 isoform X2 [Drosophila willistoni]|uniref:arginine/serine-rich coiled-coil protein 2 isoform X2 n=1 Tax=Drosophila willistoni TaxID=7260 RepID=UPI000C26CE67|nr:arginine/serine-rich coiled-coil protein 2 isoform X2 [Drosophila willistoni]